MLCRVRFTDLEFCEIWNKRECEIKENIKYKNITNGINSKN